MVSAKGIEMSSIKTLVSTMIIKPSKCEDFFVTSATRDFLADILIQYYSEQPQNILKDLEEVGSPLRKNEPREEGRLNEQNPFDPPRLPRTP